jgi:hypothetical protein
LIKVAAGDSRISIFDFGLWDRDDSVPLYSPGSVGASIYPDKSGVRTTDRELVRLRRASDWLAAQISDGDRVWCKLNCEGAETAILDDLVATGHIRDIWALRIHVDAGKVASLGAEEAARTRATVRAFRNPRYLLAEDTPAKTFPGATAAWLLATGADRNEPLTPSATALRLLRYSTAPRLYMPAVRFVSRLKRRVIRYR